MTIKITWLSHSGFQLDFDGTNVLIDPFLTGNPLAISDPQQLPADYILLTHGHGDHLGDTVPIAKRTNAVVVAMVEISYWMDRQGVQSHGQNTGGGYKHPFGHVKFVRADHSSSLPDGTYAGEACGIVITAQGKKLYFAGDTALFADMGLIGEMGIDIAFLPIGDNFTMGPDDALQAIEVIHPRIAFPIHYNTFPVIQQDGAKWAQRVTNETSARAMITDPGTVFTLE